MRKIKEILRPKFEVGLSLRAIAQSLNIGYGTVSNYTARAEQAGLNWPLRTDVDERVLRRMLFPNQQIRTHAGFVDLNLRRFVGRRILSG